MTRSAEDLATFYNGIDRRVGETYGARGRRGTCVSSLNVETYPGEVQRRRAFRTIASGPPMLRPAGAGAMSFRAADSTEASPAFETAFRGGFLSSAFVGDFVVGVRGITDPDRFTGFYWGRSSFSGTPAAHQRIRLDYWTAAGWTSMPWFLDQTTRLRPNALGQTYQTPLSQDGGVFWRVRDLTGWVFTTLGGVAGFWVRVRIQNLAGQTVEPQGSRSMEQPGVRLIDLAPINGLYEGSPENSEAILVACDRRSPRGRELGGNLGVVEDMRSTARPFELEIDREAGWLGEPIVVDWSGTATALTGAQDQLRKQVEQVFDPRLGPIPFQWPTDQYQAGIIRQDAAPSGSTVNTLDVVSGAGIFDFEHCRVRVATADELVAGTVHEVWRSSGSALFVYPDFSATPGDDTFDVLNPPFIARLEPGEGLDHPVSLEVVRSQAHHLVLTEQPFAEGYSGFQDVWRGSFAVGQALRWAHPRGHRWAFAFNPVTRKVLATNGHEILETDGRMAKRLIADNDSDFAQILAAELPQGLPATYGDSLNASRGQFRSTPPRASFIAAWGSRVFAAYEDQVYWTFPNQGIDVWPWEFTTTVRTSERAKVTGLYAVNNVIVASTETAMHELREVAPNLFASQQVAQYGFVHQAATTVVAREGVAAVVGVTADGIGVWDGSSYSMLLDDWDEVLDQPINRSRLDRASACYIPAWNQIFFAVPVGDDEWPTRIIVRESDTKRFWLWSTAYGVSSLSSGTDSGGASFLLLGYEDGFVAVLADDPTDDGRPVVGEITTAPMVVPAGRRVAVTSFLTTARTMGLGTAEVKLFGDSSPTPLKTVDEARFPGEGFVVGQSILSGPNRIGGSTFRTQEYRMRANRTMHTIQAKFTSSARWALRSLQAVLLRRSTRGRR